jgi:hypothetical protein
MIKFTEIENSTEKNKIKTLYHTAIPAEERVPFFWIYPKRKRENVSFFNIYDGDEWAGFVYFSYNKDLIYVWFFAIDDTVCSKDDYESAMFAEIKRLYPNHRVVLPIEAENENAENAKQSIEKKQFYEKIGFRETGYFVKRKEDSFEIMLIGESFHIEELYSINKAVFRFIGRFIVRSLKKQIQTKK